MYQTPSPQKLTKERSPEFVREGPFEIKNIFKNESDVNDKIDWIPMSENKRKLSKYSLS